MLQLNAGSNTYVVHNADEMKAAWAKVKSGDIVCLVVPNNPEDYGFAFSNDVTELKENEQDWHGCCC